SAPHAEGQRVDERTLRPSTPRRRPAFSRLGAALMRLYRGETRSAPHATLPNHEDRATRPMAPIRASESTVTRPAETAAAVDTPDGLDERPRAGSGERRAFPRRESVCLASVYRLEHDAPVNQ